uniref:Apple domain-containing protein n=1 Tax=Strongyloides stercoralis TaxID=6248 RepID=A0AAF5DPA3_STRER
QIEDCFEPHFHKAYSNVIPLVELWNITVEDCLTYCITNSIECHSVVYHKHFFTCQLYKNDNESDNKNNLVFASGHNYFRRISFSNDCETKPSDSDKKILNNNVKNHFDSKIYAHAIKSAPIEDKSNIIPIDNHYIFTPSTTHKPIPKTTAKSSDIISLVSNSQIETDSNNDENELLFFNPSITKYVLSEIKLGYFKISNTNSLFIPKNSKTMSGVTEKQCLQTCTNRNNIEDKKSFCQSAIYNKIKKLCIFLDDDTKEFKKFTRLVKNNETTFFDKLGMPINMECKKITPIFNVFINKALTENIIKKYASIDKLKDCIVLCAVHSSCHSISYSQKNCYLHSKLELNSNYEDSLEDGTNYSVAVENSLTLKYNVQCFQRTVRRSIDNFQPIMELFYVTPHNCIDQCVSLVGNNQDENSDCKSIVFNHFQHSCRLYNNDGNTPPAIIHPANGYDYFRRTAFSGLCNPITAYDINSHGILNNDNYNSRTAAQFNEFQKVYGKQSNVQRSKYINNLASDNKESLTIAAASSHTFNSISPLNIDSQSKTEEESKVQNNLINKEIYKSVQQAKVYHSNEPRPGSTGGVFRPSNDAISPPNSAKDLGYTSSNEMSKENVIDITKNESMYTLITTTTIKSIENLKVNKKNENEDETKNCPTTIGYYVVIGNQIILPMSSNTKDVVSYQGIEQSKCSSMCTSGVGLNGEKLVCSSINYFPISKTCEIFSILAEPHGSGSLIENDDVIYSEKFCLPPSSIECQENEIFILHVQKKLSTNIISSTSANSITSCLSLCLSKRNCKTSTFNSDENLCILSSTDIGENTDSLIDGEPGTVVIENGCNLKARKAKVKGSKTFLPQSKESQEIPIQSDLQWTSWSDCRFKIAGRNVRIRTRYCDINCSDGGLQLEKC